MKLSETVSERIAAYPSSGEINYRVTNSAAIIQEVEEKYAQRAVMVDKTDGLSIEMFDWRLNIRTSNTEPVLRLNIETRSRPELVAEKVAELENIIKSSY
jgi:phosphomannomutase